MIENLFTILTVETESQQRSGLILGHSDNVASHRRFLGPFSGPAF
jgi:hypothetical protein